MCMSWSHYIFRMQTNTHINISITDKESLLLILAIYSHSNKKKSMQETLDYIYVRKHHLTTPTQPYSFKCYDLNPHLF